MLSLTDAIRKLQAWRMSSKLAEVGRLYTPGELAALTQQIADAFELMVEAHRPGCGIVGVNDPETGVAVTVIPANSDAAEISIEFRQTARTTMIIHMGAYGELQGWEEIGAKHPLFSTAVRLFQLVIKGHYREDVWMDISSGRYEGGQSYFLHQDGSWHALGPFRQPAVNFRRLRLREDRFTAY